MLDKIMAIIDKCRENNFTFKALYWRLHNKSKSIKLYVYGVHFIDGEYVIRVVDWNKLELTGWYTFDDFCELVHKYKLMMEEEIES